MSAFDDVVKILAKGELPETLVFGNWGGQGEPELGWDEPGCDEDEGGVLTGSPPVPLSERGKVVLWDRAVRDGWLEGWTFDGGYGIVEAYSVTIWTNQSVIFLVEYDGASSLAKVPRNPTPHMPVTP